jgi:hypothetical protein
VFLRVFRRGSAVADTARVAKGLGLVKITIADEAAVFEVEGWHKLWSLRSRLEIPVAHIKAVHADAAPAMGLFDGLKLTGTDVPNIFRAGVFYQEGNFVFWDVRHAEKTVVIDLADEHFAKLIVEVEDPEASVRLIEDAINRRNS